MSTKTTSTFGARLRKALDDKRMTQSDLARAINAAIPTVNKWTKLSDAPDGRDACERIAPVLGVRAEWLRTGVGGKR